MNPYELSEADNRARCEAYVGRTKMYYFRCMEFLNSVQRILIQSQIRDLTISYKDNKFLSGDGWQLNSQNARLNSFISSSETLLHKLRVMALSCNEIVYNLSNVAERKAFIQSFLLHPNKIQFYEEELRLDYYGKAQIKFFDIERRYTESTQ